MTFFDSEQGKKFGDKVSCLSTVYQDWLSGLAVFHQGFDVFVLMEVLGVEQDAVEPFIAQLEQVGLAVAQAHFFYAVDADLGRFLQGQLSEEAYLTYKKRWFLAMIELVKVLHQQQAENIDAVGELVLLELPNVMALLDDLPKHADAENTAVISACITHLLEGLSQAEASGLAVQVYNQAVAQIGVWNHQAFVVEYAGIEHLVQQGELQSAYQQAEALLNRALEAGESAYQEAANDIATAYLELGKVLSLGNLAEQALVQLQHAAQRFEILNIPLMLSVTLSNQADCLLALGRLDEAVNGYSKAVELAERCGDQRSVAANRVQLATIKRKQKDYGAALAEYESARLLFEGLSEPQSVATLWHQIGIVYQIVKQYDAAEQAYQTSLAIATPLANQNNIASTLFELAHLYRELGRFEESAQLYQQVVNTCIVLNDVFHEGMARTHFAQILFFLKRYDAARNELQLAIECKQTFSHNAEPWITWAILHNVELACQNVSAAFEAKQHAIQSYLAYRISGGQNLNNPDLARNCFAVLSAIHENRHEALLAELLKVYGNAQVSASLKLMLAKHIAVLQGERNLSLADDPNLNYDDAAELLLMLKQL